MSATDSYMYLYHRIYLWQLKAFGEANNPKLVALLACSLFSFFNILTLVVAYQILVGFTIRIGGSYWMLFFGVVAIINYCFLSQKDRVSNIRELIRTETELQRKHRTRGCWIYVIITHALFFTTASFLPTA